MTTKKTKDDDLVPADAGPRPRYLTLYDGTRPIYVRGSAVEGFHGLGDPTVSYRVLLQSGVAIVVNATEDARDALLDAIIE